MKQGVWERLDSRWPTATVARMADRLRSPRARAVGRVGTLLGAVLLVAVYVGLLLWHDSAISTNYLPDMLYIMNAAWTVHEGLVPNVDFTERYGGFLTRLLSASMSFTGPTMKAFDYTLAMLLLGCSAMLAVVSIRRLNPLSAIGALMIVVALIVTRAPLEQPFAFKVASYATLYNRISWVMLLIAYLVAAVPRSRGPEWAALVVAGFATAAMILSKSSFVLGVPAIAAAFLLRGARRNCGLWIVATAVSLTAFWLFLDMSPAAWARLLGATAQLSQGTPRTAALIKLVAILAYNGAAVAAILFVSALLARDGRRWALALAAATLMMLALSFGIAVTTGHFQLYETTSPAMAIMAVTILALLHRHGGAGPAYVFPLWFCVLSLALPHLANGAWASSRGTYGWGIRTGDVGGLNSLLIRPAQVIRSRYTPLQLSGADLPQELNTFHELNTLSDQDLLLTIRDAVREITQLPGYKGLGILSPSYRVFPFVLGSKPIISVDHWLTVADVAGPSSRPLPADIDAIAVLRWELLEDLKVTTPLLRRAHRDFFLCRRSALWNIYLRRSPRTLSASRGCTTSGWADLVPA